MYVSIQKYICKYCRSKSPPETTNSAIYGQFTNIPFSFLILWHSRSSISPSRVTFNTTVSSFHNWLQQFWPASLFSLQNHIIPQCTNVNTSNLYNAIYCKPSDRVFLLSISQARRSAIIYPGRSEPSQVTIFFILGSTNSFKPFFFLHNSS